MQLIYEKTGKPVKVGDRVKLWRGGLVQIAAISEPRHSGSTGRVYVVPVVKGKADEDAGISEYFPSVIDAAWRQE